MPTSQTDMEPMQALDLTKESLDEARAGFEPYKQKSENDQTRKDLKKELDQAQSDYNAAVRRVEYVNELEIAEINLAKAREDYKIYSRPRSRGSGCGRGTLENAKANLTAAEARLDDLELMAPFDGTVTEKYIRSGEWVVPGQPILQLADLGHLRVDTTDLNEIDAARVQVGDTAVVTFDALPGVEVTGLW